MTSLDDIPVTQLKGVGQALADKLARLEIRSLQDLLFHLPHRYEDRTRIVPIGSLRIGDVGVVEGEVMKADLVMAAGAVCRSPCGTAAVFWSCDFSTLTPPRRTS